jgi:hypothetical protein
MLNDKIPPSSITNLRADKNGELKSRQSSDSLTPDRVRLAEACPPVPSLSSQPVYVPQAIEHVPIVKIKMPKRMLKNHPARQIDQLIKSLQEFGLLVPIVIDQNNVVRAGIALLAAAKKLGVKSVPVIRVEHLSEAKLRAFQIAHNKLAERSKWNYQELSGELAELSELSLSEDDNLTIHLTGFEPAEIDELITDFGTDNADQADDLSLDLPAIP